MSFSGGGGGGGGGGGAAVTAAGYGRMPVFGTCILQVFNGYEITDFRDSGLFLNGLTERTSLSCNVIISGHLADKNNRFSMTLINPIGQGTFHTATAIERRSEQMPPLLLLTLKKLTPSGQKHLDNSYGMLLEMGECAGDLCFQTEGAPIRVGIFIERHIGKDGFYVCYEDSGEPKNIPLLMRLKIAKAVAEAVKRVHDKEIIHRDIKLENSVIDCSGDRYTARLVDFGFARKIDSKIGGIRDDSVGTPGYKAHELRGISIAFFSKASDIFALGATILDVLFDYDLLEPQGIDKKRPRQYKLARDIRDKVEKSVCDPALKDCLLKMLSRDPAKRPEVDEVIGVFGASILLKEREKEALRRFVPLPLALPPQAGAAAETPPLSAREPPTETPTPAHFDNKLDEAEPPAPQRGAWLMRYLCCLRPAETHPAEVPLLNLN